MKDEFRNRLESFQTTLTFANDPARQPVWENQVPKGFGTKLTEVGPMVEELAEFCAKQSASILGQAEEKAQEESPLEQGAFELGQALTLYFEDAGDLATAEPFRRTLAWWQKINATDLLARTQDMIDAATAVTALPNATTIAENYGISAAAVTALTAARTDFAAVANAPAAARSGRKGYTALLRTKFAPVSAKFRDLDRLVVQFAARPNGPEFVAGWVAARQVRDSGSGSGSGGGGSGSGTLAGAPQNAAIVTGAASSGEMELNWEPRPAEENVTSYKIYRDGTLLTTAPAPPATLGGFTPGESVTLTVSAVSAAGEGPQSEPVTGNAG